MVATRTVEVSMAKSTEHGFGMEVGNAAEILSFTDDAPHMAEECGVKVGWLIIGITLEGVQWPTNESRDKIVELLSVVDAGETVMFSFEVPGEPDQKLHGV